MLQRHLKINLPAKLKIFQVLHDGIAATLWLHFLMRYTVGKKMWYWFGLFKWLLWLILCYLCQKVNFCPHLSILVSMVKQTVVPGARGVKVINPASPINVQNKLKEAGGGTFKFVLLIYMSFIHVLHLASRILYLLSPLCISITCFTFSLLYIYWDTFADY